MLRVADMKEVSCLLVQDSTELSIYAKRYFHTSDNTISAWCLYCQSFYLDRGDSCLLLDLLFEAFSLWVFRGQSRV